MGHAVKLRSSPHQKEVRSRGGYAGTRPTQARAGRGLGGSAPQSHDAAGEML